jgi:hypothetical protein
MLESYDLGCIIYLFVVYLTALAVTVYVAYSSDTITVNMELENVWEEAAVVGFEVLLRHFLRVRETFSAG